MYFPSIISHPHVTENALASGYPLSNRIYKGKDPYPVVLSLNIDG